MTFGGSFNAAEILTHPAKSGLAAIDQRRLRGLATMKPRRGFNRANAASLVSLAPILNWSGWKSMNLARSDVTLAYPPF
jgi:hypothetical protein